MGEDEKKSHDYQLFHNRSTCLVLRFFDRQVSAGIGLTVLAVDKRPRRKRRKEMSRLPVKPAVKDKERSAYAPFFHQPIPSPQHCAERGRYIGLM